MADNVHITSHAIMRYQQRVEDVPEETVRERIMRHADCIRKAASFGAKKIKVPGHMEIVLQRRTVVTINEPRRWRAGHQSDDRRCERRRDKKQQWSKHNAMEG